MITDPVCKMKVDEKKTSIKSEYKGITYYFCSDVCKHKFDISPEKYLKEKK